MVLAVATIERVISVCFPIKSKKWITKNRMRIVIGIVVFVMFILHIPLLLDADIDSSKDEHGCIFSEKPLGINWYWFDFTVNFIILIPLIKRSLNVIRRFLF